LLELTLFEAFWTALFDEHLPQALADGRFVLKFFNVKEFMPSRYLVWATGAIDEIAEDLDPEQDLFFRDAIDQEGTEKILESVCVFNTM
jgi:hypothetical protein